jgi:hypothetical protein
MEVPKASRTAHTEGQMQLLNQVRTHLAESIRDIRNNQLVQWERNHRAYERTWSAQDVTRPSERCKYVSAVTQTAVNDTTAGVSDALFGYGRWFTLTDNAQDKDKKDIENAGTILDEELRGNTAQEQWEHLQLLGQIYGTGIMELVPVKVREYVPMTKPDGTYGVEKKMVVRVQNVPVRPHDFRIAVGATDIATAPWCATERYEPIVNFTSKVQNGTWKDNFIDPSAHTFQADDLTSGDLTYEHRPGYVLVTRYYAKVDATLLDGPRSEQFQEACVILINRTMVAYVGENPFMCQDRPFVDYRPFKVPGRFWGLGAAHLVAQDQASFDRQYRTHEDALAFTAYPMTGMDASRVPKGLKLSAEPGKNLMVNGRPSEIIEQITLGAPSTVALDTAQRLMDWSKSSTGIPSGGVGMSQMQGVKAGVSEMSSVPITQMIKRQVRSFQNGTLVPALKIMTKFFMQFDPERFPATDFNFKVEGALSMLEKSFERAELQMIIQSMNDDNPIKPALIAQMVSLTSHPNRETLAEALMQLSQERAEKEQNDSQAIVLKEITMRKLAAEAAKIEAEAQQADAYGMYWHAKAGAVQLEIQADMLKSMVMNSSSQVPDDVEMKQRMQAMDMMFKEMTIREKQLDRESNERIARMQMRIREGKTVDEGILADLDEILEGGE